MLDSWDFQTSQLWPRCCGCLVTLDTTFWKKEEIPPNPLIYVLKPLLNLEKIQLTPFSSLTVETGRRVGAKAAESKTFPRHFGTELVKNGEIIGLKNARFHPKLNGEPQDSPGWKETQYCCLKMISPWYWPSTWENGGALAPWRRAAAKTLYFGFF